MAQIYNFDNKGGVFFDNSGSTFYFDPWKEQPHQPSPQPSESSESAEEEAGEGASDSQKQASDPRQGSAGTDGSAGAGTTVVGGQQGSAGTDGSAGAGTDRMTDAKAGETDCRQEEAGEAEAGQLTNRQIVILMASLMGISLSPTETSHSELSRFLSRLTGRSHQSLRQSIINYANEGLDKDSAKRDARLVASLIERFCPQVAERIRCDAEE